MAVDRPAMPAPAMAMLRGFLRPSSFFAVDAAMVMCAVNVVWLDGGRADASRASGLNTEFDQAFLICCG